MFTRFARLFAGFLAVLPLTLAPDPASPASAQHPPEARIAPPWQYGESATQRAKQDKSPDQTAREASEFRYLSAACEGGTIEACGALGEAYELGRGTPQNRPIAHILYTEACDARDASACYRLGRLHQARIDEAGKPASVQAYKRGCDLGEAQACSALALAYRIGEGVTADPIRSEEILRTNCPELGGSVCTQLAQVLLNRGPDKVWLEEAYGLFRKECLAGNGAACVSLLIDRNREEVRSFGFSEVDLMYRACTGGSAEQCIELGEKSFVGEDVALDREYGQTLFDRACELSDSRCEYAQGTRALPSLSETCRAGDVDACARAGRLLYEGRTVYRDDPSARDFLARACEAGLVSSCFSAAQATLLASAGPQSAEAAAAARYLEAACTANDLLACARLAYALESGAQIPRDQRKAYDVFAILCDAGRPKECAMLQQQISIEPDTPLALAGATYQPEPEPGEIFDPTVLLTPQEREARKNECAKSEIEFRGITYTDTVCEKVRRVIRGRAMQPGQAPWQALLWRPERLPGFNGAIGAKQRVACGGSVIARGWILTAAHCLRYRGRTIAGLGFEVRLGVHNPRADEGVSYPVTEVHLHPSFDKRDLAFDIGLVRYDPRRGRSGESTNSIARIGFDTTPMGDRTIQSGMKVYTYGWGWTEAAGSTSSAELRGARMQLTSKPECNRIMEFGRDDETKIDSMLCASGRNGNGDSACYGDSGGPLIFYGDPDRRPRVIGVVSSGRACGTAGEAGRFARVAAARKWIDETMRARR